MTRDQLIERRNAILSLDPGAELELHIDLDGLERLAASMNSHIDRSCPLKDFQFVCGFKIVLCDHPILHATKRRTL